MAHNISASKSCKY